MPYTADYLQRLYQIYLNHSKVIHYRDGCPVYSLSTPAVFSKPFANFAARAMYRTIQNRNLPNLLSFAVNDVCNAVCEHCSFFSGVDDKSRQVLTLAQAQKVVRDAQKLGVSVITFVGGEPLLREDLPEILRAVDKDLTTTVVFTNGALLAEQADTLKRAGLDSVYVSLDSADPAAHDRFRGAEGLFHQAVAGLRAARGSGLSVGISCSLTPEAFAAGELQRMIELGRQLGVHEVLVFDTMPTGRYKWRTDLIDNPDWVEDMIAAAEPYNRDARYPGVLLWAYTAGYQSVGCACGTSYFYVSPYGDVMSCDFNHHVFGNVLETPLHRIWDQLSSLPEFRQSKWGGCKIKDSATRELETVSPSVHSVRRSRATLDAGGGEGSANGHPAAAGRGAVQ
jgi:MoaA/NifB/PqqE/SkfB family radical SAM enzyme